MDWPCSEPCEQSFYVSNMKNSLKVRLIVKCQLYSFLWTNSEVPDSFFILAKPKSHEGGNKLCLQHKCRTETEALVSTQSFTDRIPVLFWDNHFTSLATDLHLQPATIICLLLPALLLGTCAAQAI